MESQQPARNHSFILVGLVALLAAPLAAAAPDGRIVLNADRYVVGTKWTLDILVDSPDPLSVRVPVPTLPSAVGLVNGPNIQGSLWQRVPGTQSQATKVTFTFKALQAGIVEIGPFEVRVGSATRTLAPVTVYLLAPDEAKRRFPVEVQWVKPVGPFYEGQAIPLMLQARNLDTLAQPEDLGLAAPPGSLWEKAVGLGEIEINSVGEDRLMNIPWGGWMVIPTKPGTLTVPPLKATVTGLTRSVGPLSLDVQPLPPEAAGLRAVGDFSYSIDVKEGDGAQSGQLVVTQEITGRGNFPYLEMPAVAVPDLIQLSRQEGTRYRAARTGYEGSLVVTWRFSAASARTVNVLLPGFRSFQPTTGHVDTWDARVARITLTPPAEPIAKPPAAPRVLDWAGVRAARPWGLTEGLWAWLLFLPGPLFLLSTFFAKGKGRGLLVLMVSLILTGAAEPPPAGFDEALAAQGYSAADLWGQLTALHPDEPGLWYNKALACQDAGRTAEAVHAFRMALRTGFQGDQAAKGLVALEEKELLTDQFAPWSGWPTNWLYLTLCLAVNLSFAFWAAQRLSSSTAWLLPLSLAVLVSAGTAVFVLGAQTARFEPDAVVGLADGPIRKVPGDLAETWMTLKAGTVVKVQGVSDSWVLVQTGYGLEGWVKSTGLLSLEAP